jgi:hypothetical protein
MKYLLKFPFLPLFIACLIVGFILGIRVQRSLGLADHMLTPPPKPTSGPTIKAANGQRNVLIILVDQMESRTAHLEGIWLVAYLPPTPHFTLVPLYPDALNGSPDSDTELAQNFSLTKDLLPSPALLARLHTKDLWWNYTIVLDDSALAEVIEASNGIDLGDGSMDGAQAVANLPLAWEDPHQALQGQTVLLKALCNKQGEPSPATLPELFFDLQLHHLSTDFNPDQLFTEWNNLKASGDQMRCRFPTIN